jgi:NitT/TauT family transport system substrate-binding protein
MIRAMRLVVALLAATTALAACGSGPASSGGPAGPVVVGTTPSLGNAGLYYAQSQGYFTQRGVQVEITPANSGSVAIPLLLNGQMQFAATDPLSAMVAISQNIPISMIAPGNIGPADPDIDPGAILVRDGGPVRTPADLAGRTVGVNVLNGLSHVAAMQAIDALGGNSAASQYVEVPLPQMVEAAARGQVDAVMTNEPFVTTGLEAGLTRLATPFSQVLPEVPQIVYIATNSYIADNPEQVSAFRDSIQEANAYLAENPEESRIVGRTSTETPPEVLDQIRVPVFSAEPLTVADVQAIMDLMLRYRVIDQPLDVGTVVAGQGT